MNNPNPFLPQGSFLEQKNKARKRLNIVVYFSISLSVVALMALLIQGCRKSSDASDTSSTDTSSIPQLPSNPSPDTNVPVTSPVPDTNVPAPVSAPTPVAPPPAPVPEPVAPPMATEDYTVIKGDTLAGIAKKSSVSLRALQEVNPGVDAKRLKIGQKLHLPPAGSSAPSTMAPSMPGMAEAASSGGEQTYKVKSGDTLTGIAKHFHVSIKAVQSANKLGTTSIKVGQVLKIPGTAASAPVPVPAPVEPISQAPVPAPMTSPAPATR